MSRTLRIIYWAAPVAIFLALYWIGLKTWFWQDDFAWLGLRLEVHDWHSFFTAMFAPKAEGTIRPWSERGFFMLFSYLFGLHALPYRVFVFANQCLNIVLVMLVTRKLTRSQMAGFLAPILWMANIALIVPMAWISAYNEIQCATFLLVSFYLFLLYTETGRRRYYWMQWLTFVLGFGALELNFVYPIIVCLYALLFARAYIRSTLPMFFVSAIYVAGERFASANGRPQAAAFYYDFSLNVRSILATLGGYWTRLLAFVSYGSRQHWPKWIGGGLVFIATAALAVFLVCQLRKRHFLPLFFLGWFLIVLGPLLPLHNHVTDYYLLVPAIGIAMLAAYGVAMSQRGGLVIFAITGAIASAYLFCSFALVHRQMRGYYLRAESARVLVQSVAYAEKIHPGKVILLADISDEAFWAGVYDSPFRILSTNSVLLTPESRSKIHADPARRSMVDQMFLSPHAMRQLLDHSGAVVYRTEGKYLRNVTRSYTAWDHSQPAPPLDPAIDVSLPFYDDQLGPGWYAPEPGYRWAAPHAIVYLPGPTSNNQLLEIQGYVTPAMTNAGALHLALSIDGHAEPAQTIAGSRTTFDLTYKIPPDLVGRPKLEIAFTVDRPTIVPGDRRIFGLAFGTFAIR